MIALERNYLNFCYIESESRIFESRHLRAVSLFLYAIKCMLIFWGKLPIRYPFHEKWVSLRLSLRWILYEISKRFLFNIEGYGEFFSGITPFTGICTCTIDIFKWFWKFFLIIYVIMSGNEWIEKQKQRLSQNCIVQGQYDCWLCSLGGRRICSILP